jgi:hypothetical protein
MLSKTELARDADQKQLLTFVVAEVVRPGLERQEPSPRSRIMSCLPSSMR